MVAFGQTFDSNAWLLRSRTQLVYPRIDAGATTGAGNTIWVAWWLTPWTVATPVLQDQARLIRSVWLTNPNHSFVRAWPLTARTLADQGPPVWNNWWFNTPYVKSASYAMFAGVGPYSYSGGAALLGAQHLYSIVASGAFYAYDGAPGNSDFGLLGEVIPYDLVGGPFIKSYILTVDGTTYTYSGQLAGLQIILQTRSYILTTSTRTILGPKRVSDIVGPPFDFSPMMQPTDSLSAPVVTVSVWSGVDPNPQSLYTGAISIVGDVIYPTFANGVAGTIYQIKVAVNGSRSGYLSQFAYLTVLPDAL